MGCSRQSLDLFALWRMSKENPESKEFFRKAFWKALRNPTKLMFEDTFMHYICKIVGHKRYNSALANEKPEWACKRCHRYIK